MPYQKEVCKSMFVWFCVIVFVYLFHSNYLSLTVLYAYISHLIKKQAFKISIKYFFVQK